MQKTNKMIELREVSVTYPAGTEALKQVDISVEKGEFLFVVGSSGSGKSTLIKTLLGEVKTSSGGICVAGANLRKVKRRELPFYRRRLGVVFQEFRLLDDRNVFENVALAQRVIGVSRERTKRNVMSMLEMVSLEKKARMHPRELSGGEKQRVAIARAMVNNPKILLADEPTGALDSKSGAQIMELFQKLNDEGVTIVMITHDSNIASHAKKVYNIIDGEISQAAEKEEDHEEKN